MDAENKMKVMKEHDPQTGKNVYTMQTPYGVPMVVTDKEMPTDMNLKKNALFEQQEDMVFDMAEKRQEENGPEKFMRNARKKLQAQHKAASPLKVVHPETGKL